MKDIPKSILDTLNERISSPLIGGYIISWILWNNKTVFVLLSTKSIEEKFYFINYSIYHGDLHFLLSGLLTPLIFSLIFIFGFPYLEKRIYKFWHARKKELRDEKQKIDMEKLVTEIEFLNLLEDSAKTDAEYYENIKRKDIEIKRLKEIITNNEKKPDDTEEIILEDVDTGELVKVEDNIDAEELEDFIEYNKQNEIDKINKQNRDNNLKKQLNINDDELTILKIIFDNGITYVNETSIVTLGVDNLNWNKFQSEKIAKNFINKKSIFKRSEKLRNHLELTEECINILLDVYHEKR